MSSELLRIWSLNVKLKRSKSSELFSTKKIDLKETSEDTPKPLLIFKMQILEGGGVIRLRSRQEYHHPGESEYQEDAQDSTLI